MAIGEGAPPAPASVGEAPASAPAAAPVDVCYYATHCLLPASAVRQVLLGRFGHAAAARGLGPGPGIDPLPLGCVLGRGSCLELLSIGPSSSGPGPVAGHIAEGPALTLSSVCEQVLGSGCVLKDLAVLPRGGVEPDLLVAVSETNRLQLLAYVPSPSRFELREVVPLGPPGEQPADLGRLLAVHPRGEAVAVAACVDRIAILRVNPPGSPAVLPPVACGYPAEGWVQAEAAVWPEAGLTGGPWGTVWAMAFVEPHTVVTASPDVLLLAVLLGRGDGQEVQLLRVEGSAPAVPVGRWMPEPAGLGLLTWLLPAPGRGALLLAADGELAVLEFVGGSTRGEPAQAYLGSRTQLPARTMSPVALPAPLVPLSVCWDPESSRVLLATSAADWYVADYPTLRLHTVQQPLSPAASTPNCFAWGPHGLVVAAADGADGEVGRLVGRGGGSSCASSEGEFVWEHVDSLLSLAPIMDTALLQSAEEAAARLPVLLAACGGPASAGGGTVRVLRPGAGSQLLQSSVPEYAGITGAWGLGASGRLLLCFADRTSALALSADAEGDLMLRDVSISLGIAEAEATLAAGELTAPAAAVGVSWPDLLAVQVTPRRARLVSSAGLLADWPAPDAISVAAVGCGWVAVAMARRHRLAFLTFAGVATGEGGISSGGLPPNLALHHEIVTRAELSCLALAAPPEGALCGAALCLLGTYGPSVDLLLLQPAAAAVATPLCTLALQQGVPHALYMAGPSDVLVGLRTGGLLRLEMALDARSCQLTLHAAESRQLGAAPLELMAMPTLGGAACATKPAASRATGGAEAPPILALTDRAWLLRPWRGSRRRIRLGPLWLPGPPATHAALVCLPHGARPTGSEGPTLLLAGGGRLILAQVALPRRSVGLLDVHTAVRLEPGCWVRRLLPHAPSSTLLLACRTATGDGELRLVSLAPLLEGHGEQMVLSGTGTEPGLLCSHALPRELPQALAVWDDAPPGAWPGPRTSTWVVMGTGGSTSERGPVTAGDTGRIVAYSLSWAHGTPRLSPVAEARLPAPCRALATHAGDPEAHRLLVAAGSRLMVFAAHRGEAPSLIKLASATGRHPIQAMAASGQWILTADGRDSVLLWSWCEATRELQPVWADAHAAALCAAVLLPSPPPSDDAPAQPPVPEGDQPRPSVPFAACLSGRLLALRPPPARGVPLGSSPERNLSRASTGLLPGGDVAWSLGGGHLVDSLGARPGSAGGVLACTVGGAVFQVLPVSAATHAAMRAVEQVAAAAGLAGQLLLGRVDGPGPSAAGQPLSSGWMASGDFLDALAPEEQLAMLEDAAGSSVLMASLGAAAPSPHGEPSPGASAGHASADLLRAVLDSARILL